MNAVLKNAEMPVVGDQQLAQPMLSVENVSVRFGGIVALDGVSFDVAQGQVFGLIGPNGAGKSTLFNCLSGLYRPSSGAIQFNGAGLHKLRRHQMAQLGLGRTFQNLALFSQMTVRENVLVGTHGHHHVGFLRDAFRLPMAKRKEEEAQDRADMLIDLLSLRDVKHRLVVDLPFGTQKRVEMARALACEPKLLLLDEPACGLNHSEMQELQQMIGLVRDRFRLTVLLVEHHMALVMALTDRIVVLNFGRKIADGTPEEIRHDARVIAAYLGAEEDEVEAIEAELGL